MIVLQSIKELFDIDLNLYALAATTDSSPYSDIHRRQLGFDLNTTAFCSGIMMINLKYWREHNAQDKLIKFSKEKRTPVYLHDQDALNHVFRNNWFVLPPKYNHTSMSITPLSRFEYDNLEYAFNPIVWHYSSDLKPWFNIPFPGKSNYIKYLKLSEFPNYKFINKEFKFRVSSYYKIARYYISRYLYPVTPNVLKLLAHDIYMIIKTLGVLLITPSKFNRFLVSEWGKRRE